MECGDGWRLTVWRAGEAHPTPWAEHLSARALASTQLGCNKVRDALATLEKRRKYLEQRTGEHAAGMQQSERCAGNAREEAEVPGATHRRAGCLGSQICHGGQQYRCDSARQ